MTQKQEQGLETEVSPKEAPLKEPSSVEPPQQEGKKSMSVILSSGPNSSSSAGGDQKEETVLSEERVSSGQDAPQEEKPSTQKGKPQKEPHQAEDLSQEVGWLKQDRERQDKAFKETQKWGHGLRRQLSTFEQQVKAYMGEGVLTEEEGQKLLNTTAVEDETPFQESPLAMYSKVWDEELENIRKYTQEADLDQHVLAFQHLLKNGDPQELEDAFGQFEEVKENPLALTRKMLDIGKLYNEEVYQELSQAGSLKAFKQQYETKLKQQQKKIDRLEKDLLKFKETSDYISSSSYVLPPGGQEEAHGDDTSFGGIFKKARSGQIVQS
jgi:hypothetical protein